jgi:mRNA-degrading endonuclease toxin of MazEF toxin-antitoxin module
MRERANGPNTETLSTERLGKKLGRLSGEELERIVEGLEEIIG